MAFPKAVAQPEPHSEWAVGQFQFQEAAISAAAIRVHKQRIGRGPTRIRTYWADADTVVTVLEQTFTVASARCAHWMNTSGCEA